MEGPFSPFSYLPIKILNELKLDSSKKNCLLGYCSRRAILQKAEHRIYTLSFKIPVSDLTRLNDNFFGFFQIHKDSDKDSGDNSWPGKQNIKPFQIEQRTELLPSINKKVSKLIFGVDHRLNHGSSEL